MNRLITLSTFVLLCLIARGAGGAAQDALYIPPSGPKISAALESTLKLAGPGETFKVWVYFTDKGFFTEGELRGRLAALEAVLPSRTLERRAKVRPMGELVDFKDLGVHPEYRTRVLETGARHRANSRWLNAVSVEATKSQIETIASFPFVRRLDRVVGFRRWEPEVRGAFPPRDSLPYGPSRTQLEQIHVVSLHERGYSGQGVLVQMLDTGFWRGHESLDSVDVIAEYDFINDDDSTANQSGDPDNQHDHGTAVLSIIGGYQADQLIGPAYGASYILAKTEDRSDEYPQEEDFWVEGIEWGDSLGAQVVSSSLGYIDWYTYEWMNGDSCVTTIAADIAAQNGIVVCDAMGNDGPDPGTMIAPADADSILSCGAVDSLGEIAGFSSRGPTYDGRIKPEVCAQGMSTYCAWTDTTDQYMRVGGTSASTPLIGGCAALLLEIHPSWTPMQVREALMMTASQHDSPDNDYGWGIANVFKAAFWPPPAAPTDLEASPEGTQVRLTWTSNVEDDMLAYRVYREGSQIDSVSYLNDVYIDTDVTLGESYTYWITAVDSAGLESDPSDTVDATVWACGDSNGDESVTPGDGYTIMNFFGSTATLTSCWSANVNGDSILTTGDGFHLLNCFGSGPPLNCAPCEF
jgi:subtilisin family serine protease